MVAGVVAGALVVWLLLAVAIGMLVGRVIGAVKSRPAHHDWEPYGDSWLHAAGCWCGWLDDAPRHDVRARP